MKIGADKINLIVKELVAEELEKLKEYDLIYKKKEEWSEAKKELRTDLVELLKNIESDDYKEGVKKISDVISSLQGWKSKIQKQLNNSN